MTRKTRIPLISAIALLVTWFVASAASANPLPTKKKPTPCERCMLLDCYNCATQQFSHESKCAKCDELCEGQERVMNLDSYCPKQCEKCAFPDCYDRDGMQFKDTRECSECKSICDGRDMNQAYQNRCMDCLHRPCYLCSSLTLIDSVSCNDCKGVCNDDDVQKNCDLATLCFASYDCITRDWKKWPNFLDEKCIGHLRELKDLHFDRKCREQK